MSYTKQNSKTTALQRVVQFPLVSSALQRVNTAYTDTREHYPLVEVVGMLVGGGLRSVSEAASHRAGPLLQRLQPDLEVVNYYALVGLDQLERTFPILNQSTEEVMENVKDGVFLAMDNVQMRLNEEMDGWLDRWERLVDMALGVAQVIGDSAVGQVVTSVLDDILSRSEEAVAHYLPLSPLQKLEWERLIQSFEDEEEEEEEEEEPGMWVRVRSLLLCLYLHLSHRATRIQQRLSLTLQGFSDTVGLSWMMRWVLSLLQLLLVLVVSQAGRAEALRQGLQERLSAQARLLEGWHLVRQVVGMPAHIQSIASDLLELGQILIQLLINTTPLYNMLQKASEQKVPDSLGSEDLHDSAVRRGSANSLFLRAMDGRPRRRRSLYARSHQGSGGECTGLTPAVVPVNSRRGSLRQDGQPEPENRRRSSAAEVVLAPIMQLMSQSQKAFEFFTSTDDDISSVLETGEH